MERKMPDKAMRLRARALRTLAWRYWPWGVFLTPVIIYCGAMFVRHRFRFMPAAANPGLRGPDGDINQSKQFVYAKLGPCNGLLPRHVHIPSQGSGPGRLERLDQFIATQSVAYPLVLKPDDSERGHGVKLISSRTEAAHYLEHAPSDAIAQEFVPGEDFGLLYIRDPDEPHGHVTMICKREHIHVVGDGRSNVRQLIASKRELAVLYDIIAHDHEALLDTVPVKGHRQLLTKSWSLSRDLRNIRFQDLSDRVTRRLEERIDEACRRLGGYHAGRIDVRAHDIDALCAGTFKILEINNMLSETISAFDPRCGLIEAYGRYLSYYRTLHEIGFRNWKSGASRAETLTDLLRYYAAYRRRRSAEAAFAAHLDRT